MTISNDAIVMPTEIRAPRGADNLEIRWADGHQSMYSNAWLRGWCPCATCQGHSGTIRFHQGLAPKLDDIGEVGNYALSLRWSDGHTTGIYSFRYLRELCMCPACLPTVPSDPPERTRA